MMCFTRSGSVPYAHCRALIIGACPSLIFGGSFKCGSVAGSHRNRALVTAMIGLIRLCQIIASYSSDGQTKLDGSFISLFVDSRLQEGPRDYHVTILLRD